MAYPPDPVDIRPAHYGGEANPFEPIKIIEHYSLDFCLGNAIKYILRAGRKDSETVESDLAKAEWYVNRARGVDVAGEEADESECKRLKDIYDEDSYFAGMNDAAGMPSLVLRAIIFGYQEHGPEERFIAESELLSATAHKAVEIERVELNGIPGFMLKVVNFPEFGRVNDMSVDGEIVEGESLFTPEEAEEVRRIHYGDPGDEHEHVHRSSFDDMRSY